METAALKWETIGKINNKKTKISIKEIINLLLENRGLKTEEEKRYFFKPTVPEELSLTQLKIKKTEVGKALKRLNDALVRKEKVIVYGDYDADGICATAILWEIMHRLKFDCLPYLPERFSEGYGINKESIGKLKEKYPDLGVIITVDNGIVANDAVEAAKKAGIDIIITDHHQPGKTNPDACSVIHTTKISGSAVSWIFSRELADYFKLKEESHYLQRGLELAAVGSIADQLPLIGANRSFAFYGLKAINLTERTGLIALFNEAGIKKGSIGTYEVNFLIAPRINAMGRMEHAIDSLRLLCTTDKLKADALAAHLSKTNVRRQQVVEEVVLHARNMVVAGEEKKVLILADESYHEGVIGLAASRLVEEFYKPCIVISKKGEIAKASARSIPGFNIIENIKKVDDLLLGGGGHPMAAGFSIAVSDVGTFIERFEKLTMDMLTDDVLTKRLKADMVLEFSDISYELLEIILKFAPFGIGNPNPVFVTKNVKVVDLRLVGKTEKHVKLKIEKDGKMFDAIGFNFGGLAASISPNSVIDVAYNLEENIWNGSRTMQLKIKDIKFKN